MEGNEDDRTFLVADCSWTGVFGDVANDYLLLGSHVALLLFLNDARRIVRSMCDGFRTCSSALAFAFCFSSNLRNFSAFSASLANCLAVFGGPSPGWLVSPSLGGTFS